MEKITKKLLATIALYTLFACIMLNVGAFQYNRLEAQQAMTYDTTQASDFPSQSDSLREIIEERPWIIVNTIIAVVLVAIAVSIPFEYRHRLSLYRIINTDALTGLSSQHKLIEDAQHLLSEHPPGHYSFITLDIDNFKYLNEMYGYQMGSQLLQLLGNYIHSQLPPKALLARSSSDTFLILTATQDAHSALSRWEEFDEALQQLISESLGLSYRISFSAGIYQVNDPSMDVSVMIDYANLARNRGKTTSGFTYHFFTEAMSRERTINNEIITAMVPAIQNKEFVLYYQPKLDMRTNEMTGAEVLVRWMKDGHVIPPNHFIPLFERNGFIETLDYYVLARACAFLQAHSGQPIPRLSVNLSSVTMLQPKIVQNILDVLSTHQISPTQLDLEITETAFVENSTTLLEQLSKLRQQGFTISMDDFGTGVSSLNRLKNMELDTLKIDRMFIVDSLENPRSSKILRHVINMAKDLNLETVAEGIETPQQRDFLTEIGCDLGQGYLFSRPLPEAEFLNLCQSQRR